MLRQAGGVLVPVAIWLVGLVAVGDAVLEGTVSYAVQTITVTAAICWAAWVGLFSPRLEVAHDGLVVVNPLRVHAVPFAALDDVRVRGLVELAYRAAGAAGEAGDRVRRVTSWNAPGLPRRRPQRPGASLRRGTPAPAPESRSTTTIESFQAAWRTSGGPARDAERRGVARWRSRDLGVLAGLVLLAFVTGLLS